jgi:predicted dithiol-disulfide oxidoreductase (DUF899 family)
MSYDSRREELREAELELMRRREQVAQLRRDLPEGSDVGDYTFIDVDSGEDVKLADLFSADDRSLILYHYMFGKKQTEPCPMCSMWIDGYNGIAHHVRQRADFVVLAAATPDELRDVAKSRGWDNIRLLSAGDSTFKKDFGSETEDGEQIERVSVYTRHGDVVKHHYSSGAELGPGQRERGIDLLSPVWHLFDLTPEGRGNWYPSLTYQTRGGR